MLKDYSTFQIPGYAKRETEVFEAEIQPEYLEIYQELNGIAEELELCRLRNS